MRQASARIRSRTRTELGGADLLVGSARNTLNLSPWRNTRPGAIVGNPRCAIFVKDFEFDWKSAGAAIENYPLFRRGPM